MVIGRAIRADIAPFTLAFWRWVVVLCLTLPFVWSKWRKEWPLLQAHWKNVLWLGLFGVSAYNALIYIALQHTAATNAVLLNSFIPVATIILAWVFLKKTLSLLAGAGVLISLLGVTVIVARGELTTLYSLSLNIGDLWMLASVLTWAMYTIGLQFRPAVSPMVLLAAMTAVGILGLLPFYIWELTQGQTLHFSWRMFSGMAYICVVPGFFGFVFYNHGVAEVGPARASLFIHLMPVFGTLLSVIFLAEVPQVYHFYGLVLIFSGIYLTTSR